MARSWLITGVSRGFGRVMAEQLLAAGDAVFGTVRREADGAGLSDRYPATFRMAVLDMADGPAIAPAVDLAFAGMGRIDVVVSNAGYGLFGAAEEASAAQIDDIVAVNLTGSIKLIGAALPHLRAQGGGRIIQISSYAGQVAFPGASLYHATKWGVEGFVEAVAREVAGFNIGLTLVEPGGARTGFRYGGARVADPLPAYEGTPAHAFRATLDPARGLAPGDPARMVRAIIDSVDVTPAPLRLILGGQAQKMTVQALKRRLADIEAQASTAAAADHPPGE